LERISRDDMNMNIACIVSKRSTCARAQVGAVAVKHNRVVSIGYGGAPSGMPHCTEVGCVRGEDGGCISTIHAEANVIAFSAKFGISLDGAVLYTTISPCYDCAKLIINSGIKEVVYLVEYRKTEGIELLKKVGIKIRQLQIDNFIYY